MYQVAGYDDDSSEEDWASALNRRILGKPRATYFSHGARWLSPGCVFFEVGPSKMVMCFWFSFESTKNEVPSRRTHPNIFKHMTGREAKRMLESSWTVGTHATGGRAVVKAHCSEHPSRKRTELDGPSRTLENDHLCCMFWRAPL